MLETAYRHYPGVLCIIASMSGFHFKVLASVFLNDLEDNSPTTTAMW